MYHLDGREIDYNSLMNEVVQTMFLEDQNVHYAYHWGVDIYWIHTPAPHWADRVKLNREGLVIKDNKVIEPLLLT